MYKYIYSKTHITTNKGWYFYALWQYTKSMASTPITWLPDSHPRYPWCLTPLWIIDGLMRSCWQLNFPEWQRPPILRPLKDTLMLTRSKLAPDVKSKSRVRYLPRWPFVELKVEGQAAKHHEETLMGVARKVLGFDHIFKISENT